MKITFNPSTVAALTTPPNNKDITFDLRGRNIFARGVKFYGTDTNTWRDIKINNVSIGSHTLDLRNGSNTTLTNTNGVVTINSTWRPVVDNLTSDSTTSSLSAKQGKVLKALIDGKSNSDHNHDGRYLRLSGQDTMQGNLYLHSYGSSYIGKGSGDKSGADFTEANIVIRSWWGISFKSYDDIVRTYIDTRTGNIGTKGVLNAVGAVIQGRVYNGGDDEGIIINPAPNGYAGLILGTHNGERSVFYLKKGNPFWRYNNGSTNLDIYHPKKSGTIALTSDIPNKDSWNYDDRYLRLTGGWMSGDINFGGDNKIHWGRNTDSASISFKNDGDGDTNSYMSFVTSDNGNEYFRWSHNSGSTNTEWMALRSDGLRVRGTKVSLEGHSHNDLYYTKAESNAKYITDIATSVNKLTFTRNGSNIARNITVNVVYSQGKLTNIPNKDNTTKASSGLYIYDSYNQVIGTNSYSSVLSINTGGTIQIAGDWGDYQTRNLYWRSQSDRNVADYPWKSWRTILDSENYSSTLDSRYYTESEVNSLLDAKLNRQNLSYGTWNPRGWNLAADYNYNGGEISISESGGKIHVSVDGYFWQNEGQYRVLDTSDVAGLKSNLTVHQYLIATDATWYPLVWGGNAHQNTSDSTGAVYKSYDKLSWQTSSQTLYATNIQTNNIKNLSIGGGIYWNPYVESGSNDSDAASITLVKSGVAGGTTLVLSQMNDNNDTIQFKTNTAARLYHNSYPILTTQNTYVNNNKGYINGSEITQVNNSDKVDNRHAISTTPNTGIIYKAAIYITHSLTSYWVRLASIPSIALNTEFVATIHVQSGHSGLGRYAILLVYLRGGESSYQAKSFKICCNTNYDPNRFRLYYKDSNKTSEIWYNTIGRWDGIITTVISQSSEGSLDEGLTLYSGVITAVQTPSMSTYLSAQVSTITDNISGNASTATKLQTARSIWGQSFDGTGNVSGSLSEVGNINFKVDNSYDIGSAFAASRYIYTHWLGARSGRKLELGANNSGYGQGLCIDTNLNVGIGTNSPAYKLHVNGTLYATNIQTNNIKNLSIGGGIYWNPYVESGSNDSDAASITLVKSGVAGGTTLVLSQMNDNNDTIQFKTNTAARLYHNSYPILTTQNTYVNNNKGYINGSEITQVNNSDKVDNRHAISTTPNTGIIYKAAIYITHSLTSYWVRLASIPSIALNTEFVATIHVQSGHSGLGRYAILLVYLRGGESSYQAKSFKICCNTNYDPNRFRLYYKDSNKTSEIWYNTIGRWDGIITTVISQSSEGSLDEGLTLYSGVITAVQTPSMSTYLSAQVSTITDNISGNASTATKLQTARSIWGQSFDGTGNVSGSLSEVGNINFKVDNSYDIGSAFAASRYIYTHWLGARSGRKLELGANNSGYGQGLCIDTNLNVGIGTNSPAYKLHVNGTFQAKNSTVSDLFVNTGDATLKIYTGITANDQNDGNICFQTSINATDGQSHAYPTEFQNRCNIVLQPRGGQVYIGTNPGIGNTTYKLYVNSKIFSNGGFVKNGSSDSYVLLGGGGHKLESSLNVAYSKYLTGIALTGGHNNDGGYRLIFEKTMGGWDINYGVWAIAFRHSGRGTLNIGFDTTNSDGSKYSYDIRFLGSTASRESTPFRAFYNAITKVFRIYWHYYDYTSGNIAVLRGNIEPHNGTWMTSLPNDVGTELAITYNMADQAVNADTVDGVHLNGIFTGFSYAQSRLTATIGTVSKTVNVTGSYPSIGNATMNTIASYGNCMGMAYLTSSNSNVNPNNQTSWHHFINMSYNTKSTDMWQTQFAIKAGTTEVWVRSRAGGSISDSSAWAAPWVRLARITDNIASATNADMVDGYHENSFLRYRGATYTDQEATLWSQIGIKQYNNALPDNLTGVYNYGSVISLPGVDSRFEIYASHASSNGSGLYYRSGWANDKKAWLKFIDSSNIGSQSVNYANSAGRANSAGSADTLGGMPKNYGQAPFGTIPCIGNDGVMEIGKYIDFHYDNSGSYDYSTRIQATGNYKNTVTLPSESGTLALTSYGGDYNNPIFLGYLNLYGGGDGTISSYFYCLGYSVPFTYTRGGNYCKIIIPDTTHLSFYIKAATASVNYSGGGMDTWTGYHRGSGAWWLHCYAYHRNEVRVKGFCQANDNNDSWWGGNPLWDNEYGANKITVCIFGYVNTNNNY